MSKSGGQKVILSIRAALLILCLSSVPVQAQFISLWADSSMNSCSVFPGPPPNNTFDMYIFIEPDARGIVGVEFSIVNPSPSLFLTPPGTPVFNPAAGVVGPLGDFFGNGITMAFRHCQYDPIWVARYNFTSFEAGAVFFTLGVTTSSDPPVTQETIRAAICDVPHTVVEAFAYNHFGINQACVVGTEESSWGAIKSLYR